MIYLREAGAERCPEEGAVRGAVTARLGYDPFSPQAQTTLTVVIRGAAKGLEARIEMADALGELTGMRQLGSARTDCEDLAPTLALAISIAIDPLSITRPNPIAGAASGDSEAAAPTVAPAATLAAPVPAAPRKPEREPLHVRAGVGVLAAVGNAPSPAIGFTVRVGVRQRRWSLSVEARGDLPASKDVEGGQLSVSVIGGALVPCVHFGFASAPAFEIAGCALLYAGAYRSEGSGFSGATSDTSPLFAAGGRVAVEMAVVRAVTLLLYLDGLGSISHIESTLENNAGNQVKLYSNFPVSAALGFAAWVNFR